MKLECSAKEKRGRNKAGEILRTHPHAVERAKARSVSLIYNWEEEWRSPIYMWKRFPTRPHRRNKKLAAFIIDGRLRFSTINFTFSAFSEDLDYLSFSRQTIVIRFLLFLGCALWRFYFFFRGRNYGSRGFFFDMHLPFPPNWGCNDLSLVVGRTVN